jgi:hypothetical protein
MNEDSGFKGCAKCGGDLVFVECENCIDGFTGHDCGEDCCCCEDPDDNVTCDICFGRGGWDACVARCSSKEAA